MDTIFAVSSGTPPAAIAVLRVSGPAARETLRALAGAEPAPRVATLRALGDPMDGMLLDRALVLWFPGPASATGEDLVELHLHGGRAVIDAVQRVLAARPGLRAAEPGEFTRRALLSGRIDLTEAEGLGDLLAAETESQRRAAIAATEGGVRRQVAAWGARLLALSAQVEAMLDFADEDDVAASGDVSPSAAIAALAGEIGEALARPPVERLRDGVRVAIAGPPNSGKSTLLNALVERDAAITSPIAGTTRDRIEAPVVRDGVAYLLIDTAGLREATDDPIEAIGIDRTRAAIAAADIVLWLGDDRPDQPDALWIAARSDDPARPEHHPGQVLAISALRGDGIWELWGLLAQSAGRLLPALDQVALNRRQRDLLGDCARQLSAAADTNDPLIIAEHLRLTRRILDRITGHHDVEDMLDHLFGRFCIGK